MKEYKTKYVDIDNIDEVLVECCNDKSLSLEEKFDKLRFLSTLFDINKNMERNKLEIYWNNHTDTWIAELGGDIWAEGNTLERLFNSMDAL